MEIVKTQKYGETRGRSAILMFLFFYVAGAVPKEKTRQSLPTFSHVKMQKNYNLCNISFIRLSNTKIYLYIYIYIYFVSCQLFFYLYWTRYDSVTFSILSCPEKKVIDKSFFFFFLSNWQKLYPKKKVAKIFHPYAYCLQFSRRFFFFFFFLRINCRAV